MFELKVTIPSNTTASIIIPANTTEKLLLNGQSFKNNNRLKLLKTEADSFELVAQPGIYTITTQLK